VLDASEAWVAPAVQARRLAQASLRIRGVPSSIPLREVERGVFVGRYTVARSDRIEEGAPIQPAHTGCHTHVSHALSKGAVLMAVRDNRRHASIATISILRPEDVKRARQMGEIVG
jgi:hypothetical protein